MKTELPERITADMSVEIFGGNIILINPTDCCIPTVEVITPWGSIETTKITVGQTITFINENNQSEFYSIRSTGSEWTPGLVIDVRLIVIYEEGEPLPESPIKYAVVGVVALGALKLLSKK